MGLTAERIHGRILDVDSHGDLATGPDGELFDDRVMRYFTTSPLLKMLGWTKDNDFFAIGKGGATLIPENPHDTPTLDMRAEVLDLMGIRRSLIFPNMALFAMGQASGGGFNGCPVNTAEEMEIARGAIDAWNEAAAAFSRNHGERLRLVGVLMTNKPGLTPNLLLKETERLIALGLRAIMIPSGLPPAGVSPANRDLDPWYAALAAKNIPLLFHSGGGAGFRKSNIWGLTPEGESGLVPGVQGDLSFPLTVCEAEQNFVTVMTMGGVFERHPTLRVGAIEAGSMWIGPLAARLDAGFGVFAHKGLSLKPSEYFSRNLRVSALFDEPVERQLEIFPEVRDCICQSSDFPHPEGRTWSMQQFYQRLAPLGDEIVEKFFCKNSELLLP